MLQGRGAVNKVTSLAAYYLKDVLARLPTQKNSRIDELLPHRWTPLTT